MEDAVLTDDELKHATIEVDQQEPFIPRGGTPAPSKGIPKTTTVNGEDCAVRVYTSTQKKVTVYVETEEIRVALEERQKALA